MYCQESNHWVYCVIVINVIMSIPIELYPKLDQWTANKLHYITLHYIHLTSSLCSLIPGSFKHSNEKMLY
jgi:hypothetical protein